jgi:ribonuclease D
MKFEAKISKEEIMTLPVLHFQGKIFLIDNFKDFNRYINRLYQKSIWGFDTETKPSFRKGQSNQNKVALLQLSSANECYLFRLNKIGIPDELINFLSDDSIIKVGLSIKDDNSALGKLRSFKKQGFIDLQSIVNFYGIEDLGLRNVAAIVLGQRISKSQQLTNWEADELTDAQKVYAATDAWACREIYLKLINNERAVRGD